VRGDKREIVCARQALTMRSPGWRVPPPVFIMSAIVVSPLLTDKRFLRPWQLSKHQRRPPPGCISAVIARIWRSRGTPSAGQASAGPEWVSCRALRRRGAAALAELEYMLHHACAANGPRRPTRGACASQ